MLVTTTTSVPAPRPLPSTPHLAGPVMNLPITGGDRDAGLRLYGDLLGMPLRFDHTYADPGMNRILGLPEDRVMAWTIFSIGDGRLCDHHYPEDFVPEPPLVHPGRLRPGAAGHTFVVDDLADAVSRVSSGGYVVRGPVRIDAAPYDGRSVAAFVGADDELVELVG